MRFVFVSDSPDQVRGGIERHAAALTGELARRGHAARLVAPSALTRRDVLGGDWVVFDGIRRLVILRHAHPMSSGPRFAAFSHGSFLEEARVADLRAGGVWMPDRRFRMRRWFDRTIGPRIFARIDRWIALNAAEASDLVRFLGVPASSIRAIGPFVSPEFLEAARDERAAVPTGDPYVCAIARVERRKNFGVLLEAVSDGPYRFLLAGQDRGGLAELQAAGRRLPSARWEYLGTIPERRKVDLIRGAAAVVVPSVSEGVPALALEALVLGRPVVLAGLAYGPDGPGVIRCGPDAASIRTALLSVSSRPPFEPIRPPTVEAAADEFLAAVAAGPSA